MIFLEAIDLLSRDELLEKVAFLRTVNFLGTLREFTSTFALKAKRKILPIAISLGKEGERISDFVSKSPNPKVAKVGVFFKKGCDKGNQALSFLNKKSEWDPRKISEEVEREKDKLSELSKTALQKELIERIATLAGARKEDRNDFHRNISKKALAEAAKVMKINMELVSEEQVEKLIFEKFVETTFKRIKKRLAKAGREQEAELKKMVKSEIDKLGEGDREALRRAMGMDELTAESFVKLLRSGAIPVTGLIAAEAAGFGLFLAATTALKAVSLLMGVTFAFGTYTTAASLLGFFTGPIGGPVIVLSILGTTGRIQNRKFKRALLASEIVSLHAKLLSTEGGTSAI